MAVVPLFPSPGPRAARGSGAELEASLRLGGKGSSSSLPLSLPHSQSASHGPSRPRSADQLCLSALLSTGVCGHALTGPPGLSAPGYSTAGLGFSPGLPPAEPRTGPGTVLRSLRSPGPDQNCRWLSTHIRSRCFALGLATYHMELTRSSDARGGLDSPRDKPPRKTKEWCAALRRSPYVRVAPD